MNVSLSFLLNSPFALLYRQKEIILEADAHLKIITLFYC